MTEVKPLEVLPECQTSFSELKLSVGLMERDLSAQAKITDRLTEAVEKIQELNSNLFNMIQLHELKHTTAAEDIRDLEHRVEVLSVRPTAEPETTREAKKTLDLLEKWKYMILGAALVVGWLLGNLKWSVLVSLFGG